MRTRPAAHLLDDAYIAKYQRAYYQTQIRDHGRIKLNSIVHIATQLSTLMCWRVAGGVVQWGLRFTMGGCFSHGIDSFSTFTSAYWQSFWATTTHLLYPFGIGIINHQIHHLRMWSLLHLRIPCTTTKFNHHCMMRGETDAQNGRIWSTFNWRWSVQTKP